MADVKISGLPASTVPLAGTEVLPIVQSGQTRQVSVANLTAGRAVSASSLSVTGSLTSGQNITTATSNGTTLLIRQATAAVAGDYSQISFGFTGGGTAVYSAIRNSFQNPATVTNTDLSFLTNNGTNTTEKLRVFATGGVSIGNTTDKGAASLNVSGLIFPQQAATASAPAYQKGAIYFDTTLNKLRVGGATGWETITST
jgi:hypothetical protein